MGYKFNDFNYQDVSKTLPGLYDSLSTLRLSFSVEQFFDIPGLLTNLNKLQSGEIKIQDKEKQKSNRGGARFLALIKMVLSLNK